MKLMIARVFSFIDVLGGFCQIANVAVIVSFNRTHADGLLNLHVRDPCMPSLDRL